MNKFKIQVLTPEEMKRRQTLPTPKVRNKDTAPVQEQASSTEKITAADLQKHIEKQINGQCDTVSFRK